VSPRRECVPSGTTIRLPGPMTSGHGGIAAEIRVVRVRSEGQSRIRPTKLRRGLRSAAAPRVSASDPRLPPKGILKAQISYNLAPWDAFTLYAPLANGTQLGICTHSSPGCGVSSSPACLKSQYTCLSCYMAYAMKWPMHPAREGEFQKTRIENMNLRPNLFHLCA
jgi:hypothetical protein